MKQYVKELYEDRHLLIVNKPPGMLTQCDDSDRPALEEILRQKHPFVYVTHRLDYETSGLVICAKSSKALSRMQALFREHRVEKQYLVYVLGMLRGEGEWCDGYQRTPTPDIVVGGDSIRLHYTTIESLDDRTLLNIALYTGKKHQIRLQCSRRGYPICGDQKYGGGKGVLMLAHWCVAFPHPIDRTPIRIAHLPVWLTDSKIKETLRMRYPDWYNRLAF